MLPHLRTGHLRTGHLSAWLLVSLGLLSACAGQLSKQIEPPEVSLAGLGMGAPSLFEQQLRLDLRLRNPNDFAIDVERVRFELEVQGESFANGWTETPFLLPALGDTVVPVTVYVQTLDLIDSVLSLGVAQRLDYRISGRVELDNLLVGSVPFEREGKFAFPDLPGLSKPGT
jgi:LEA14-like dessication related protein